MRLQEQQSLPLLRLLRGHVPGRSNAVLLIMRRGDVVPVRMSRNAVHIMLLTAEPTLIIVALPLAVLMSIAQSSTG